MTRHLHHKLTNTELAKREGCRYEGRILSVEEHLVFNKFKYTQEEVVPLIAFEDGWEWVPNIGARRVLTEAWGAKTDFWIGRRMAVFLKTVVRIEKGSGGRGVDRQEKFAEPLPGSRRKEASE